MSANRDSSRGGAPGAANDRRGGGQGQGGPKRDPRGNGPGTGADRRGGSDPRNAQPAPANGAMAEALRRAGLVNDKDNGTGKQDRRSNRP